MYLSTSGLLSSIISNTDKHEFSSTCTWKWIRFCNDVMNHIDCVIKRGLYPQKMHSCSENIREENISFCFKNIRALSENISWVILHGYFCVDDR